MSLMYRDEAIVLLTHKLGEADRIVTLLTREHGKVRAVAKGVRRTSSKFGARLEPFMMVDVQLRSGRNLDLITQAETIGAFAKDIGRDYSLYTTGVAMLETAERLIAAEHEPALQQYWLLVGAVRSLARRDHTASLILDSYLLRAMALAGWAASFEDCAICGARGPHASFSIAYGGSVCPRCRPPGAISPAPETLVLLAALLSGDWEVADAADPRHQREATGIVAAFSQFYLERQLRSLRHVDRT